MHWILMQGWADRNVTVAAGRLECTGTAGKQEYHLSRWCLLAMGAAAGWLKGMIELELKQI
jgi:hypothetical protein